MVGIMVPDKHAKFHNQPFIMRRAIWRHVFRRTHSLTHNGVPLLLVDLQMALVRNYAIQSTGSSIVYMLTLDCLGN